MEMEPFQLTATQVLEKFQDGTLAVEEYARSLLSRIEERDAAVQAWAYLDPEYVIQQAKQLDAVPPEKRGPLHGVAIAVKDIMHTKGRRFPYPKFAMRKLIFHRYANSAQLVYLRG